MSFLLIREASVRLQMILFGFHSHKFYWLLSQLIETGCDKCTSEATWGQWRCMRMIIMAPCPWPYIVIQKGFLRVEGYSCHTWPLLGFVHLFLKIVLQIWKKNVYNYKCAELIYKIYECPGLWRRGSTLY
jgi:hypothetical protein